jgi:hypothetical protein
MSTTAIHRSIVCNCSMLKVDWPVAGCIQREVGCNCHIVGALFASPSRQDPVPRPVPSFLQTAPLAFKWIFHVLCW